MDTAIGMLHSADTANGAVQVFIRPESVELVPGADGENIIGCKVTARRFAGDNVEYDLMPNASGSPTMLRARVSESVATVRPGDACNVRIMPSKVRLLAAPAMEAAS